MQAFGKWVFALASVLFALWFVFGDASSNVATAAKKSAVVQIPDNVAEQQLAHALALWRDENYQQASLEFSALAEQNLSDNLQSLTNLYQYHALAFQKSTPVDFKQQLASLPKHCKQTLLFVTPDIESLVQADYFRSRFNQDPRLQSLAICIHSTTWFDPKQIVCEKNWQQSGRLGCELLSLAEKLKNIPFTHLVLFADQGKANVHNGIMFLDREDTYDVFIHELAHFSGFIDEYPLSKSLAKRVCAGVDAPNMVFKQKNKINADLGYWQTIGLQDDSKLFTARTCDNHSTQAFKASKQLTFMEYHDTAFIPAYYLSAWQKQLQTAPSLPSAHVNFAQLYEQSNNLTESQFWRTKYQQYLSSTNRLTDL